MSDKIGQSKTSPEIINEKDLIKTSDVVKGY